MECPKCQSSQSKKNGFRREKQSYKCNWTVVNYKKKRIILFFKLSGKGGLPEDPQKYLRGQSVWQDLRILKDKDSRIGSNESLKSSASSQ